VRLGFLTFLSMWLEEKSKVIYNQIRSLGLSDADAKKITEIFINELKGMDVEKRPVHCTDAKRETVYIKDNDTWEKENDEKKKFKWVINRIAQKNLNKIQEWQERYPAYVINNSIENERYTELALVALGGRGEEEDEKYRDKIMKNVLKEVIIDKSTLCH